MQRVLMFFMTLAITLSVSTPVFAVKLDETKDKWLVYWYVCGSNLESERGEASKDIDEMMRALPKMDLDRAQKSAGDESAEKKYDEDGLGIGGSYTHNYANKFKAARNIKFLVQTGGANEWKNDRDSNETITRRIYDSDGWHYQGALPDADMGDPRTLADFLRYGKEVVEPNFKPDHRMFIFWDHGGFLIVCFDHRHENDKIEGIASSLDLNDIHDAFSQIFPEATPDNPPFEIIGFDACCRGTYENANNLYGFAKYVVASQNKESGIGWYYTDWIRAIADNPSINGKRLGEIICQTSYDKVKEYDDQEQQKYAQDIAQYNKNKEKYEKQHNEDYPEKPPQRPNVYAPEATFSVVNLSREDWENFRKAYDTFGDALSKMMEKYPHLRSSVFVESSNFYFDTGDGKLLLLDLSNFAEKVKQISTYDTDKSTQSRVTKAADNLMKAIDSSVEINVVGDYYRETQNSRGISSYFPSSIGEESKNKFKLYQQQNSAPEVTKKLVDKLMNTPDSNENKSIAQNDGITYGIPDSQSGSTSRSASRSKLDNANQPNQFDQLAQLAQLTEKFMPILVDQDKSEVSIQFTKNQMQNLNRVEFAVVLTKSHLLNLFNGDYDSEDYDEGVATREFEEATEKILGRSIDDDIGLICLGFDADLSKDTRYGYFSSHVKSVGLKLDGHFVFANVQSSQPDEKDSNGNVIRWGYTDYSIPILINGVSHDLKVSYKHSDNKYTIIGAQRTGDEVSRSGMSSRGYVALRVGDKITPLFMGSVTTGDILDNSAATESGYIQAESFTLSANPVVESVPLPDGNYAGLFVCSNIFDSLFMSEFAGIKVTEGHVAELDYIPAYNMLKKVIELKNKWGDKWQEKLDDVDEELFMQVSDDKQRQHQAEIERRQQIRENWNKKK